MAYISYTMCIRGLPDMYVDPYQPLGFGCTYQENHLRPWYNYNMHMYVQYTYICMYVCM